MELSELAHGGGRLHVAVSRRSETRYFLSSLILEIASVFCFATLRQLDFGFFPRLSGFMIKVSYQF